MSPSFYYALKASFFIWLLTTAYGLRAQSANFSRELRFAQYLADKDAFDEATYVLQRIDSRILQQTERDSLAYYLGWTAYSSKSLDQAAQQLLAVSPVSAFYQKSRFFGAYCLLFQGKRDSANVVIERISPSDSTLGELKALQLAGITLLQRRLTDYQRFSQIFTYSSYAMAEEQKRLDTYYKKLSSQKHKSPFLAGLYSSLIPGLGKIYAGKKMQGIAALLPVVTLGLLTFEGYRKDGPRSLRFLGFGSLFTVFYVGNVWGSALAVKIKRDEFNREYDNKILFDLHIPMRNLFQ
ncbi:hypothetical protein BN8_06670 [Fibrisoma limi BUZ 3]|uniref:Tetratricopeptide repeat protein n=1 Tax=Fibrisoma limi BUZ 3 TaxID=1185876 RepID=I2GTN2_9BACT|nr:hypothetical protein [Fibrisoma limi]CCH57262.1 hypothetical protein BN8_06670 [Fibrisoma limi BUZ 3]